MLFRNVFSLIAFITYAQNFEDVIVRRQRVCDRIGLTWKRGFPAHRSSIKGSVDETDGVFG